eukprot:GILJ01003351.1.p1 GENE.GILJ01003351.1~~GILJ01003351.1.p1  ORF type:complete len:450 (+),score=67.88 GILJ01003351.1:45-1394(+)
MAVSHHIVVDSGALIKGARFKFEDKLYSVEEVFDEIRDEKARERLASLPAITFRQPSDAAMQFVINFARKTGDLSSLSKTDLKVLALTYMIHQEQLGTDDLRKEPAPLKLDTHMARTGSSWAPAAVIPLSHSTPFATDIPVRAFDVQDFLSKSKVEFIAQYGPMVEECPSAATDSEKESAETIDEPAHQPDSCPATETAQTDNVNSNKQKAADAGEQGDKDGKDGKDANKEEEEEDEENEEEDVETDGEGDWITPANFARVRALNAGSEIADLPGVQVACVTTDFAMQNVLLQIGLRVMSVDGLVIKTLKHWVFKCHACYKICPDMSKKFCPKCGNNTLQKTPVRIDAQGVMHFLPPRKQQNIRGTIYSLPKPQGGRRNQDLILREDQLMMSGRDRHMRKLAKQTAPDAFDLDYTPTLQKRVTPLQDFTIGYGRRNPNERRKNTGNKRR